MLVFDLLCLIKTGNILKAVKTWGGNPKPPVSYHFQISHRILIRQSLSF